MNSCPYSTVIGRDLRPGMSILARHGYWQSFTVRDVVTLLSGRLLVRYDGGEFTVHPDDEVRIPAPADEQEGLF